MTADNSLTEAAPPRAVGEHGAVWREGMVLGFGTAVWVAWVAYLCHVPTYLSASIGERSAQGDSMARAAAEGYLPPGIVITCLLLTFLGGGVVAGRLGGARVLRGAIAGGVGATINLLMLLSAVSQDSPDHARSVVIPGAGFWIVGSLILGAALGMLGARWAPAARRAPDGSSTFEPIRSFARITAGSTFLLILIGGMVTGHEAGMAVYDWPTSFGSNMFLYPLASMTGGVFLEHAHRLFATLVGFTTLGLGVYLYTTPKGRGVRWLGLTAFGFVVLQGVLGGLRVRWDETWGTELRVTHGIAGQLFLGVLVLMVARTSRTWSHWPIRGTGEVSRGVEYKNLAWSLVLLAVVVVQLVLGALTRHVSRDQFVMLHLGFALFVALVGLVVALRTTVHYPSVPALKRSGIALALFLMVQLLLGFVALAVTDPASQGAGSTLLTTLHQGTGALILALAILIPAWVLRSLAISGSPEGGPSAQSTESASSLT